jgi:hypothetical protein
LSRMDLQIKLMQNSLKNRIISLCYKVIRLTLGEVLKMIFKINP